MSPGFSPASSMALSAASACNWICDRPGMTPSSVVSAAPTTAMDFCFISRSPNARADRLEQRQGNGIGLLLKSDLKRHVELQGFRRLRAADNVGHHARALGQL